MEVYADWINGTLISMKPYAQFHIFSGCQCMKSPGRKIMAILMLGTLYSFSLCIYGLDMCI